MAAFKNRLAAEKSPYLLQHAHNPVDWFPWGAEAFEEAAKEEKPIFLSIGYATCHWCHVMERESFENEEVARALNETFVCIKVDREERPDIDQIYMSVCHMMTGQGGWPLTILMTPEKKPFYAATYIPPDSRFGRLGMSELIPRVGDMWNSKRADILESAVQITQRLNEQHTLGGQGKLDATVVALGYQALLGEYDSEKGGFGLAPKFPTPHKLLFLLRSGEAAGIRAAEHTLTEMRKGGLFDHVGLGFHRYSTDADWLLPHFEKMLYDQALLVMAYTEAFELTRKSFYRQVAEEILTYVLRDMTAPEGGFYSAEDADSEGEEGRFYVWSAAEMEALLGDDYAFAARSWNISSAGNYRDEATGQRSGNNIPHWSQIPGETDAVRLESIRKTLYAVREERIHPLKDTKILADWNGLMIAALAQAGRVFAEPRYVGAAQKAYAFIQQHMRNEEALWHRYRDGHTAVAAQLEDYAFIIWGLLELYGASFDPSYLEEALRYNQVLQRSFKDETHGGYFMTADHEEEQIVRPKNMYDGAIPSGNSVQMYNLLRLARLTGRFELEQEAEDVGNLFGGLLQRAPTGFTQALTAIQFYSGKTEEIVIVGRRDQADTQAIIDYIHSVYHPGKVVLLKEDDQLKNVVPFTESMQLLEGKPTVYLCRNFACENPIISLEELKKRID